MGVTVVDSSGAASLDLVPSLRSDEVGVAIHGRVPAGFWIATPGCARLAMTETNLGVHRDIAVGATRQGPTDDMPKVMVVEDEEPLCMLLRYNLEAEGYAVETVMRGDDAD